MAWQQCKKCDGGKKKKGRRTSSGLGIQFVLFKIVLIFLFKSEYPFWGNWFSKKYIIIIVFVGI